MTVTHQPPDAPEPPEWGPHASGQAECLRCGRCWVAVWPCGAVEPLHLECPSCGAQVPTPRVDRAPSAPMEGR